MRCLTAGYAITQSFTPFLSFKHPSSRVSLHNICATSKWHAQVSRVAVCHCCFPCGFLSHARTCVWHAINLVQNISWGCRTAASADLTTAEGLGCVTTQDLHTSGQNGGAIWWRAQAGILGRPSGRIQLAGGIALADRLAPRAGRGVGSRSLRGGPGQLRESTAGQCAQQDAAALDIGLGRGRRIIDGGPAAAAAPAAGGPLGPRLARLCLNG